MNENSDGKFVVNFIIYCKMSFELFDHNCVVVAAQSPSMTSPSLMIFTVYFVKNNSIFNCVRRCKSNVVSAAHRLYFFITLSNDEDDV